MAGDGQVGMPPLSGASPDTSSQVTGAQLEARSSLKTILFESVSFQIHGSGCKERHELSPISVSRLLKIAVVTEAPDARRIDDNGESGALKTSRLSRSVVSLGRPLPS